MKVSVRLDDVSPLIQYTGAWRAGNQQDVQFSRYSDGGTFTLTDSNDAYASLDFSGTRISVFGAKRGNHDNFTIALDSSPKEVLSGHADGDEVFQVPLFTSQQLPAGRHTFTIQDASTDAAQPFLDIDFIEIDTEVDGDDTARIEDSSPSWTYDPPDAWYNNPLQLTNFSGSSGHSTMMPGGSAIMTFTGTAVDLYGLLCPQCGTYWVSLDDGPVETFNAYNAAWTKPQTLLYMARDLPDAEHSLKVTNLGYPAGATLNLDYLTVYGHEPKGVVRSEAIPKNATTGRPRTAEIVGAVMAGLFLLLLGILFFFIQRRRRRWPFSEPAILPFVSPTPVQELAPPIVFAPPLPMTSAYTNPNDYPFAPAPIATKGSCYPATAIRPQTSDSVTGVAPGSIGLPTRMRSLDRPPEYRESIMDTHLTGVAAEKPPSG